MALVFLSYSRIDGALADSVAKVLEELDIEYFRDVKDIDWGDSFTLEIRDALERAAAVLVVVSPASLKSQWVPYELGFAAALRKKVLPYLAHESVELPPYLRDVQYVTTTEQVREYFSQSNYRNPTPAAAQPSVPARKPAFDELCEIMPGLLIEMKKDLSEDTTRLIREFVLLPVRGVIFNSTKRRFFYVESEHPDLKNKVDLLEQHGFVVDVTPRNTPIYRMTEEFVRLLREAAFPERSGPGTPSN